MRAPFNATFDLYCGPATSTPFALRHADVPGRLVSDLVFVDDRAPLSGSVAYLTLDEVVPFGPDWVETSDDVWEVSLGDADLVALSGATETSWMIVRVESREYSSGLPYWRCHLIDRVEPIVGCSRYLLTPWSFFMDRTGPLSWGYPDHTLTTDGLGNWEIVDVLDDLHYLAAGWDGHDSKLFVCTTNPEDTVTATCVD